MVAACHHIYVDANSSAKQRDVIIRDFAEAGVVLDDLFGNGVPRPALLWCVTDACQTRYSGPSHRSHTVFTPTPTIVVNGLAAITTRTITHEMVHVEIGASARREERNIAGVVRRGGVATYIGDNASATRNYRVESMTCGGFTRSPPG